MTACGALAFTFAVPAPADPPPSRPDYLFALPEREWVFAKLLWQGRESCTAELCEAGYHSGDMVVSLIRVRDAANVVAGVRDCSTVSYNYVRPDQVAGLSPEQRHARLSDIVRNIAAFIHRNCNLPDRGEAIDTAPLTRLGF
jgi:hypothetical protein